MYALLVCSASFDVTDIRWSFYFIGRESS